MARRFVCEFRYTDLCIRANFESGNPTRLDEDLAIRKAISCSHFICLCLSSNSVTKRGWVQLEMKQALQLWEEKLSDDIFIIPIRFDECEIADGLKRFQWVDILPPFNGSGWNKVLAGIKEGMRRRSEKQ
jgi:hypothetical protein